MNWKLYFRTLSGTIIILSTITFGSIILNNYKFWGYFNLFIGSAIIYFLCYFYFESIEKKENN